MFLFKEGFSLEINKLSRIRTWWSAMSLKCLRAMKCLDVLIRESLLISKLKPSLNKNIRSFPLSLF